MDLEIQKCIVVKTENILNYERRTYLNVGSGNSKASAEPMGYRFKILLSVMSVLRLKRKEKRQKSNH